MIAEVDGLVACALSQCIDLRGKDGVGAVTAQQRVVDIGGRGAGATG